MQNVNKAYIASILKREQSSIKSARRNNAQLFVTFNNGSQESYNLYCLALSLEITYEQLVGAM